MTEETNIEVGDTVRGEISYTAPHPDDPHPENPSRTTTKTHEVQGLVLKRTDGGVIIKSGGSKTRLEDDEITELVEKGHPPSPVRFVIQADGEDYAVEWNPDTERYEVQDTSQFEVWGAPGGEVQSSHNVYKNVDPRIKDDVRKEMNAVADALRERLRIGAED